MKGLHFNIHTKIIAGYVFILICLVVSLLIVMNRMSAMQKEVDFVTQHDMEVHNLANQIQKNVLDMETGMRGFVITGDEEYLEPYNTASKNWLDNYNTLHSLLADNGAQKRNLEEVKPLIMNWITNSGSYVITQKKASNQTALDEFFNNNKGKKMTDELRAHFDSFLENQKNLTNERVEKLNQENNNLKITLYGLIIVVTLITITTAILLSNSIVKTIKQVVRTIKSVTDSRETEVDLSTRIEASTHDETRELAEAMNELLSNLEKQNWVQKSVAEISTMYQGMTDLTELTHAFISKLTPMLEAVYGVVYLRRNQGSEVRYVKEAGYAIVSEERAAESFRLGEGLIGQAAMDKRIFLIDKLPEEHFKVASGLGQSSPRNLLVAPIMVDGRVEAVVEFAAFQPFMAQHLTLIDLLQDKFGSAITNVAGRMEVERLLGESQVLTEELQAQSEELQAQSEELQMQQEQLRITNEYLEEQRQFAEQRAFDLKKAKDELEDYSRKLQLSSQYKTDFLANMSHELRTPLNSILILSQMLMETEGDMDNSEVKESSRVIYTAGSDLLRLIDDILDLSKIEAGKIEILTDEVNVTEIPQMMKSMFDPVAAKKNLTFEVMTAADVPSVIRTDGQRLQQIWKNLLSNAFKFTEQGSVTVKIECAEPEEVRELLPELDEEEMVLAISVTDTGIGIAHEKQQIIFEAFQQVDGTTNRLFGGTGLGLSICREFTRLLGGVIMVQSEPEKGSTFTLYIPGSLEAAEYHLQLEQLVLEEAAASVSEFADEHQLVSGETDTSMAVEAEASDDQLFKGKKVLLVEDDRRNIFALVTALEKKGVKVQVAENGKRAIEFIQEQADFDLVFMDIMMPVMGGYEAMKVIRQDLEMERLPIIALTAKAMKGERDKCMEAGASDYIMKPLNINQLFSLMRVWLTEQVSQV
ncbi:two-component system chemotaxis sensor kinase CheA [Bacillus niacini]|uniref:Circadian input-output histidine kinase CikA n=1 Tax=Neobacillus niacini TaxID=86668 RepID=A0A852TD85_9BACI|nr:CHASE3 domain-containing protein [Neobacillus niacini]NYE05969.1 two-component system chemotaxis sensor kinase CheA [Neobacillus niacini]